MDSTNKALPFGDIDPEVAALVGETQAERDLRERLRHPPKLELTDDLVRAVTCGPQERWLLDSRCPGLALRIRPGSPAGGPVRPASPPAIERGVYCGPAPRLPARRSEGD
jgi:hypothetical protein